MMMRVIEEYMIVYRLRKRRKKRQRQQYIYNSRVVNRRNSRAGLMWCLIPSPAIKATKSHSFFLLQLLLYMYYPWCVEHSNDSLYPPSCSLDICCSRWERERERKVAISSGNLSWENTAPSMFLCVMMLSRSSIAPAFIRSSFLGRLCLLMSQLETVWFG